MRKRKWNKMVLYVTVSNVTQMVGKVLNSKIFNIVWNVIPEMTIYISDIFCMLDHISTLVNLLVNMVCTVCIAIYIYIYIRQQ